MQGFFRAIAIIALSVLGPGPASAAPGAAATAGDVWRIGSRSESFALLSLTGIPFPVRVSSECGLESRARACDAVSVARKAADPEFRRVNAVRIPASRGGSEPGSRICRGVFAGNVVLGESSRGDRNAFCTLQDGSRISTGSLASVWEAAPSSQRKKGR